VAIDQSEESDQLSEYLGERANKNGIKQRCRFRFMVKGDQQHHFIAAASCFAKLRREIAMEQFNTWWKTKVPNLKSTAGYWVDGQRFIKNIEFCREQLKIPTQSLIRAK
jgi:ribonuclease HII